MEQRGDESVTTSEVQSLRKTSMSMMGRKSVIVVAEGLGIGTSQRHLNWETKVLWDQKPERIS